MRDGGEGTSPHLSNLGQGQLLLLLVLCHPHGGCLLLLVEVGVDRVAMSRVGLQVSEHPSPEEALRGGSSRASSPGSSVTELSAGRGRE